MNRLLKLAVSALAVTVIVAAASPVAVAGPQPRGTRSSGSWYTPSEVKAMFRNSPALTLMRYGVPLAGPWYTHRELQALKTYSNASFAEKQKLLAAAAAPLPAGYGLEAQRRASGGGSDWGQTAVEAVTAAGLALLATAAVALVREGRAVSRG